MATTAAVTSQLADLPSVGSGTTTRTPSNALGKNEFLMLLTVQMRNQDPTKPVDNKEMIAQLAQFSQLETMQGLSDKVDAMVTATDASSRLTTTQLVGKQALFNADKIGLVEGQRSSFDLALASATDDTTAVISDANGKVVRTLHLGPQAAGTRSVSWDGLSDAGKPLPAGEYYLSVSGTKKDGTMVAASARVRATITAVAYENGVAQLVVGGRTIPLSDVVEISLPTAGS